MPSRNSSRANSGHWNNMNYSVASLFKNGTLKKQDFMSTEIRDIPLTDNTAEQQFEMNISGHIAFIAYEPSGDALALTHTEVPMALEGKGIGSTLVEKTLSYIEEKQQKIVPLCPFVSSYIKRHQEWQRIVQ